MGARESVFMCAGCSTLESLGRQASLRRWYLNYVHEPAMCRFRQGSQFHNELEVETSWAVKGPIEEDQYGWSGAEQKDIRSEKCVGKVMRGFIGHD